MQSYVADAHFSGFGLIQNQGRFEFEIHNGKTWVRARAAKFVPQVGEKVHLAGVYTGRLVAIFINGQLEGSVAINRPIKLSKRQMLIGGDPDGSGVVGRGDNHAHARIFEVRILNMTKPPGIEKDTIAIHRTRSSRNRELLYLNLTNDSLKEETPYSTQNWCFLPPLPFSWI